MAYISADRVKETTTTTGTSDLTLAGAVSGYVSFSSVMSTSDTTHYCVFSSDETEWEVGLGTLSASTTLQRTTVLASSNGGSKTSFSSGTKTVFLTHPASFSQKLEGIETAATADQSDSEIKTAYENNADTNAFTDADESKLDNAVTGPGSSTDNAIARFDSTTGKIVQNSGVTIDDNGDIDTAGEYHVNLSDSTPGTPVTTTDGVFMVEGADGTKHLRIFGDSDGDGDYDYDMHVANKMYLSAEDDIHLRPEYTLGGSDVGRFVFQADTNINRIISSKNFANTTYNDLYIAVGPTDVVKFGETSIEPLADGAITLGTTSLRYAQSYHDDITSRELHIDAGTSQPVDIYRASAAGVFADIRNNEGHYSWGTDSNRMYFYDRTVNAYRFTIGETGNVGIGTGSGDPTAKLDVAGTGNFTGDVTVPDEAYGAGWNGSLEVPTKNAVYDKIETISSSGVDTSGTPVANDFARFTDADTIEGRSYAETRADLSLEVGTDVQAWDAILDDLSGLTQATDKLPYFDSATTMATTDLTAFGRSLIDDASASAARTTLDAAQASHTHAYDDIDSGSRTGSDTKLVTGTAGSNTNFAMWNGDGDLVSSGVGTTTFIAATGDSYTGNHDMSGATLEIPNSATLTLASNGEFGLDHTVTDFSGGVLKYYSGEEFGIIAMPIAEFTSPANGAVPTYNSTTDDWEASVPAGGGTMSSFTLSADSGSDQTIEDSNTLEIAGGAGIATVASATDTVTVAMDISGLTDTTAAASDAIPFFDASDSNNPKRASALSIARTLDAASTSTAGKVELATTAETQTGTATGLAVTPDGLNDMTDVSGKSWVLDEDNMASDDATKLATQQSIKAYVDANSGGTTNNFNNRQVDQSGGTSDTHGALAGSVNGSNTVFTVSNSAYVTGSLSVYLNGQLQIQGSSEDWTETTPASGTFTFATAPETGDEISVIYDTQETSSTDVYYERTMQSKSAAYTVLSTDLGVDGDASSAGFTLTLPALSGVDNLVFYFSKSDSSGNSVTLDGNGSETINGSTTYVLNTQYQSVALVKVSSTDWRVF